jgi:uncharacterized protein YecA (UPF0149 family)
MSKKNLAKAKKIQYQQYLAANPQIKQANTVQLEAGKKIKRNEPCPCKSGLKYKKCCGG